MLRQLDSTVANSDAFLFKPAEAINVIQGGDNGTPTQKDEATTPNPPNGAAIDYYLKTATTSPVTIEIVNSTGAVVGSFTNNPDAAAQAGGGRGGGGRGGAGGGGIPNTSALWRPAPEPFNVSAGMHRVYWTLGGGGGGFGGGGCGRGGGAPAMTGAFTVRMTVNGKTYTQPLVVKPDPRQK